VSKRVVVTGLGLISPCGNTVQEGWANVRDGVSGITPIDQYDASAFSTRFAGTIRNFDPTAYMEPKEARKCDPFMLYGIAAGVQAIRDSGIEVTDANAHRYGVAVGSGIGGIHYDREEPLEDARGGSTPRLAVLRAREHHQHDLGTLSINLRHDGPELLRSLRPARRARTASGSRARMIQHGDADVMVAGGAEYCSTQIGLAGFCAARALSQRNDAPTKASRPWDRDRDGFVLSDGAGCVVLEDYEHAKARGARIYAEFVGFGMSSDAHHITAPPENGQWGVRLHGERHARRQPQSRASRLRERARNLDGAR
jgi:3-oxoacyl-[acyl-carrier-protein] synthase II